ncbi:Hexaprenyldihydroxybenzoate methyltransferase, mitochondrial [Chamberlinius hualienensis]
MFLRFSKRSHSILLRTSMSSNSSIKPDKIRFFDDWAEDWWDPNGRGRAMHKMIPLRFNLLLNELKKKGLVKSDNRIVKGLEVLDVGCGAGLLSEQLAAFGANVTAIDPSNKLIEVAKMHAETNLSRIEGSLQYYSTTVEDFVINSREYDVICVFLVLDHINTQKEFLINCFRMLKPKGSLFIIHMNPCWIHLCAYYWHTWVTKAISKNVITFSHLISNKDLLNFLKNAGCTIAGVQGFRLNLSGTKYVLVNATDFFNFIHSIKN